MPENLSHEVCELLYGEDLPVYCPVSESNTVATVVNGSYVCPRCEQVEGSNGSDFHGLPR